MTMDARSAVETLRADAKEGVPEMTAFTDLRHEQIDEAAAIVLTELDEKDALIARLRQGKSS